MLKAKLFDTMSIGTDTRETYLVKVEDETYLIEHWFDKTDYQYAIYVLDEDEQERVNAAQVFDEAVFNDIAGMCYMLDSELA